MELFKCPEHGEECPTPVVCAIAQQNPDIFEQGPIDPINPGEQAAQHMAFVYRSYRSAGFDTRQSLYLAAAVSTGNPGVAPYGADPE